MNADSQEEYEFDCPRCGGKAYAYSLVFAGCVSCGILLYTEIPDNVRAFFKKGESNGVA